MYNFCVSGEVTNGMVKSDSGHLLVASIKGLAQRRQHFDAKCCPQIQTISATLTTKQIVQSHCDDNLGVHELIHKAVRLNRNKKFSKSSSELLFDTLA